MALFSKIELHLLRQVYHQIVYALGSTSSINLSTLKSLLDDNSDQFTIDPDMVDLIHSIVYFQETETIVRESVVMEKDEEEEHSPTSNF